MPAHTAASSTGSSRTLRVSAVHLLRSGPEQVVTDQRGIGGLEVQHAQQFPGPGRHHRSRHRAQQADIGEQLPSGQLARQGQAVGQHAEQLLGPVGPGRRPDGVSGHPGIALVGPQQPHGHGQQGRLAGAVRPDQAEERPWPDVQVHIADGQGRAEGLAHAPDGQPGNLGDRGDPGPPATVPARTRRCTAAPRRGRPRRWWYGCGFHAPPGQRPARSLGEPSRQLGQHARGTVDQQPPDLLVAQAVTAAREILGEQLPLGGDLRSGIPGAHHDEGAPGLPFRAIIADLRQLELTQQMITQVHGLGDAPEPVGVPGHPRDGQQLVDAARRKQQAVVSGRPAAALGVGELDPTARQVDPVHGAEQQPGAGAGGAQRHGHPARIQDPRRHLGQQRQVQEVIGGIDQRHCDLAPGQPGQPPGGVHPGEAGPHDDHPPRRRGVRDVRHQLVLPCVPDRRCADISSIRLAIGKDIRRPADVASSGAHRYRPAGPRTLPSSAGRGPPRRRPHRVLTAPAVAHARTPCGGRPLPASSGSP